jgi:hypothetical protein
MEVGGAVALYTERTTEVAYCLIGRISIAYQASNTVAVISALTCLIDECISV